jgi:DNA-binding NtrC family response regulator
MKTSAAISGARTPRSPAVAATLAALIGSHPAIVAIRNEVEKLADSKASVLITGPTGSGKDVVAQLLHQRSCRAARSFVALNCAAIAPDLLESEMFGHEAGAFTGAIRARPGRFEAAHGGTLFLDEIGDMPLAMQAKLLRALETRVVERVGSMLPIAVDVRLVAATSVDLVAALDRGNFRSDLLYRVDVIRIVMPALADHASDIPLLVARFTAQLAGPPVAFDTGSIDLLMRQPWHGNVRELKNFVERAQAHFPGVTVGAEVVAQLLARANGGAPLAGRRVTPSPAHLEAPALVAGNIDLKSILSALEQAYIVAALQASGGTIAATAKRLGLQRTTLIEKMRRLQIAAHGTA